MLVTPDKFILPLFSGIYLSVWSDLHSLQKKYEFVLT